MSGAGRAWRAAGLGLLSAVLVAVMVRLSLWQWGRARATGSLLNYTYAVEWLLFAVLTVVGLVRLAREGARTEPAPEPPVLVRPGGPQIGPPLAPGQELEEITWVRLRRRAGLGPRG